ncbi:MAG: hypothetical protein AB9880_08690 [Christensenellales bacterium]
MLYCERCHLLSPERCQQCGGRLREPRVNDPVLLTRADTIRAAILSSLLDTEKIPCSKVGRLGAALAMQTGGMLEEYSLFVPYGAYEEAQALIKPVASLAEEEDKEEAQERDPLSPDDGEEEDGP